ncbi:hypothetical protein [Acidithiobacillus ferridurans]|uniref:Rrf2 family transcriptional regulator n=1 Tax=Acidithiobacillus ferridurans TaxID=1232575 RepID=A0A8X8G517_ACIFI|nr:hypothetical protein [Acidithiobacillus ferridurans]MBU2715804.1 Rrf2 family transcriptional regulator [Acidithiobacillus ferridurans]MBU2722801.1 Rrf2 family transcriptional regulator [Acidithiobacillus ferridurans]MBU2727812.1 Rrf2 family transcriptional regulator [Acidithiobacillus ferridurans]
MQTEESRNITRANTAGAVLRAWIAAAMRYEGAPASAARLAILIPSMPEPHHVSQQLYELKKAGFVEKAGQLSDRSRKPVWRLTDDAEMDWIDDLESMLREIAEAARGRSTDELYSDRVAVRREMTALMQDRGLRTKSEILAGCPSAKSEHEVSQILHDLVREGIVVAEGESRKRLYWLPASNQGELEFASPESEEFTLERAEGKLRLVFQRGQVAKRKTQFRNGIQLQYDPSGYLLDITIHLKEIAHV